MVVSDVTGVVFKEVFGLVYDVIAREKPEDVELLCSCEVEVDVPVYGGGGVFNGSPYTSCLCLEASITCVPAAQLRGSYVILNCPDNLWFATAGDTALEAEPGTAPGEAAYGRARLCANGLDRDGVVTGVVN